MEWIKMSAIFPEEWTDVIIRIRGTRNHIIREQDVSDVHSEWFEMDDGENIDFWKCEWLHDPESINL